ncbi:MAG: hypothetical protein AAGI51_07945 [Pseudomonadota bacterium]
MACAPNSAPRAPVALAATALAVCAGLAAGPASATAIDAAWPDPVTLELEDPWADPSAAPDLGGPAYGEMVGAGPGAPIDLTGVLHPLRGAAPEAAPARPVDGFAADPLAEMDRAATAPTGAPLDATTGGAPLPWEARPPSVFADVLRNAPERVLEDARFGLRDPLIAGLVARASALPPPVPAPDGAPGGAPGADPAEAAAPPPTPAALLRERAPLLIILAILVLMSATIMVIARPTAPKPKLLTSRRFGH